MSSYLSSQFKLRTARFLTHRSLSYVCRSPSTPVILALEDTEDGGILDKVVARLPCPTVRTQQPQNNRTKAPARKRLEQVCVSLPAASRSIYQGILTFLFTCMFLLVQFP